jgi:hypothetical protein
MKRIYKESASISEFIIIDAHTTKMSVSPAFYFGDQSEHGFRPIPNTRAEIEREAEIGEKMLRRSLIEMRCPFLPYITTYNDSKVSDKRILVQEDAPVVKTKHGNLAGIIIQVIYVSHIRYAQDGRR